MGGLPVFKGLDRGNMAQRALGDMVVVESGVPVQGRFQVFGRVETVSPEHLGNAAVEPFHPPVGLRMARGDEAMLDVLRGAGLVKDVIAGSLSGPVQEPVGEFRAVVGQAFLNAERGGLDHRFEESLGGQGGAVGFWELTARAESTSLSDQILWLRQRLASAKCSPSDIPGVQEVEISIFVALGSDDEGAVDYESQFTAGDLAWLSSIGATVSFSFTYVKD
jgi:hypothetical protein